MDKYKVVELISVGWLFITIPCFMLGLFVSPFFTLIGWIAVLFQFAWLGFLTNGVAYAFAEWLIKKFQK